MPREPDLEVEIGSGDGHGHVGAPWEGLAAGDSLAMGLLTWRGAWEGIPKPGMGFISCPAWVFCQLPASSENLKTPQALGSELEAPEKSRYILNYGARAFQAEPRKLAQGQKFSCAKGLLPAGN